MNNTLVHGQFAESFNDGSYTLWLEKSGSGLYFMSYQDGTDVIKYATGSATTEVEIDAVIANRASATYTYFTLLT